MKRKPEAVRELIDKWRKRIKELRDDNGSLASALTRPERLLSAAECELCADELEAKLRAAKGKAMSHRTYTGEEGKQVIDDIIASATSELRKQLAHSTDAYERLEGASRVQLKTIDDLRDALLHLAQRTHEHSAGCDACKKIEWELKAARESRSVKR